jgi:predicted nucleotide-binding protein
MPSSREIEANFRRLQKLFGAVGDLDTQYLSHDDPYIDELQAAYDDALDIAFGKESDRYKQFRRTLKLELKSRKGDVIGSIASAMDCLREDYAREEAKEKRVRFDPAMGFAQETAKQQRVTSEQSPRNATPPGRIFIGHGRSPIWRELKDFLKDRLNLSPEEFNSVPVAGTATTARLREMLQRASFAFIIMTAEDEQPDGKKRARENVVHEVGLFQGRLGFERAIILLEEGCEEFSNIHGLGHIRFPKGNIGAKFEEIRQVLEREQQLK